MKIKSNALISKVELKKNTKGEAYLNIEFLDLQSGDSFNVISKDIELMSKVQGMNKYNVDLNLSSSKYGLKLELLEVSKSLGTI